MCRRVAQIRESLPSFLSFLSLRGVGKGRKGRKGQKGHESLAPYGYFNTLLIGVGAKLAAPGGDIDSAPLPNGAWHT
jgi:hypothetical protein